MLTKFRIAEIIQLITEQKNSVIISQNGSEIKNSIISLPASKKIIPQSINIISKICDPQIR